MLLRIFNKSYDEMYVARMLIKKGDIVFDVGANVGHFSILFSVLVGIKGEVHAFEPVDKTFFKLIENLKNWNLRSNIKANKIALSDESIEALIYTPNGDLTQSSLTKHAESSSWYEGIRGEKIETQKVTVTTIDAYIKANSISHINYIKCDVEGAEFSVLKGALGVLSGKNRPIILLEFFDSWANDFGYDAFDIFDFLKATGNYSIFHIQGRRLTEIVNFRVQLPGRFPDSLNYLCLPPQIDSKIINSLVISRLNE
jgi:FkbM family methyltransferase